MASIKITYVGGGSSRAPGTVAGFVQQGKSFSGSEIVLVDIVPERLEIVRRIAEKMAAVAGVDLRFSTTTDRRAGLAGADAVLTSFRPGGFEARVIDERIPLRNGIIGQETQGPGGFFMALRSLHVMKQICAEMAEVCPGAFLVNYTNPVNIVAQAVADNTDIPVVSLCEGPFVFARRVARAADLDPARLDSTMIGLNHGCWSVRHLYDGEDAMPLIRAAYEAKKDDESVKVLDRRLLQLASRMGAIPAEYFQYYYFKDDVLSELSHKATTRAEDILAEVPDYWQHYREQSMASAPELDPARSRGGVLELELAIDVIDAIFNDRGEVWPVNVPNRGAIADFPDDLVVEVPGFVDSHGATPLVQGHLPRHLVGLLQMLGNYQALAAAAGWNGTREDAIRALASHPLVFSLPKAEKVYDEMASELAAYLPERLL